MTVRRLIQELINYDMESRVAIEATCKEYPLDKYVLLDEDCGTTAYDGALPVVILKPQNKLIEL